MQCYARSDFTGTLTCKDIMFKGIKDGGEGLFYNKLIIQQLLYMLTVECMLCVFAGDFIGHQLNSAVRLCMITVKVMQLGDMIIIMVIGFIDNKDIFKILGQIFDTFIHRCGDMDSLWQQGIFGMLRFIRIGFVDKT